MYLVGLPRIAADLYASEAQLHIAFSVYLAGDGSLRCYLPVKWPIVQGESRSPYPARRYLLLPRCSVHWLKPARYFLQADFYRGLGAGCCYVVAFAILRDTLDDRRRAKVLSITQTVLPASFRC